MNAIEITDLCKTYRRHRGKAKEALQSVNLSIPRGSIFALLGPNGAGKSTLINILGGIVGKTSGQVKVWGYDLDTQIREVKLSLGIVPQEIYVDPFFTPRRILDIQAGFFGVPRKDRITDEILTLMDLQDKAKAYTMTLSGGMKRRLMVAKAMVHAPPILILDEPTAGVDIELRQKLWETIRQLNAQGTTIVLTTHYLEEAQALCDRVAIMHHGALIACEDTQTLLARVQSKEITLHLDKALTIVPSVAGFTITPQGPHALCVRYNPQDVGLDPLIAAVRLSGYGIADISTRQSELEEVFLQLTRT